MNLKVNGDPQQLPKGATLGQLLEQLGLGEKRLAVERNGDIVLRSDYTSCVLEEGDKLEIVQAIGGG